MTETIDFSRIGIQDLRFGTGTFSVVLADGQVVTLDEVNLERIISNGGQGKVVKLMTNSWYPAAAYDTLSEAVSAAGSSQATIIVVDNQSLSSDLTVPRNVTLKFAGQGQATLSTGVTLTIAGRLEAELRTIFSTTGTVSFSGNDLITRIYPQWWGASGASGASSTTNTTAINAAITAADTINGTVFFGAGTYSHTGISWPPGVKLIGESQEAVILDYTSATGNGITLAASPDKCSIEEMKITNSGSTSGWAVTTTSGTTRELNIRRISISGALKGIMVHDALNIHLDALNITGQGKAVPSGIGVQIGVSGTGGNGITVSNSYINTIETGIISYGQSVVISRPILESCTTGVQAYAPVTVIHPWVSGTNTTDFDLQAASVLVGYGSSNHSVSYLDGTVYRRTIIIPERLDIGDKTGITGLKLGRYVIQADGTIRLLHSSASNALTFLEENSANTGGGFHALNINGISNTTTRAENLRGTATFATAATVSVSFGTAESDTSYFIVLSGNANETFYWSSKTVSGFTINSSNGSSTATVDWMIVR